MKSSEQLAQGEDPMPSPSPRFRTKPHALLALGITVVLLAAAAAPAAEASTTKRKSDPAQQTPKARAKFNKGSGETTPERDRRLLRECKGRPNAGACLGYAS
jgi:hypothetical protein